MRSSQCKKKRVPNGHSQVWRVARPAFGGEAAYRSARSRYQTRQLLTGIIGWPALQPKASPISGIF